MVSINAHYVNKLISCGCLYMSNINFMSLILFVMLTIINVVSMAANKSRDACQFLRTSELVKGLPLYPSQIIVVKSSGGIKASMTLCQRNGDIWKTVFIPFRAVIGKNGIALPGEKKEGDRKTPAGLFPVGETFGTQPLALKMDYKYITAEDKFIDDANHPLYNTWVSGATDANRYESMLIEPYTYGAVINYNRTPVTAGAGSAIFIHLWRAPNLPTTGCIALDKRHLLMLLHWLDKAQHPHILVMATTAG